jgi:hypothetical protein
VLYPIAAMRPRPASSVVAKFGLLVGGTVAALLYLSGFVVIRWVLGIYIPTVILGVVLMVPAVLLGMGLTMLLGRSPQVLKLQCGCGWRETFRVSQASRPSTAPIPSAAVSVETAPEEIVLQGPPPAPVASEDTIIDDRDARAELEAWIHTEFVSGRQADEILAALVEQGWPDDDAETLVEQIRKQTRHRRP